MMTRFPQPVRPEPWERSDRESKDAIVRCALLLVAASLGCDDAVTAIDYDAAVPVRCSDPVMALRETCAGATEACLGTCAMEDDACQRACIDADPDAAACAQCLDVNELVCYLDHGCEHQWDALSCCPGFAACAERDDFAACVESSCPREWEQFRSCSSFVDAHECEPVVRVCFGP